MCPPPPRLAAAGLGWAALGWAVGNAFGREPSPSVFSEALEALAGGGRRAGASIHGKHPLYEALSVVCKQKQA